MVVPMTTSRRSISFPLTQKSQVTVPVDVRRHLGIGPRDRIVWILNDDGTAQVKPVRSRIRELGASISEVPGREGNDYEEVRHLMLEDLAEEIVRDMGGL